MHERKIITTPAKSRLAGELPKGCGLCITGEKLVVFVSGLCPRNCFYCTLSDRRKNAKISWANEQIIESDKDILREAKLCEAKGAGITGGEPLLSENIEKTLHYISILKKEFGKEFHIHLYTSGIGMSESVLEKLKAAGLDEIRFHLDIENESNWQVLKPAQNRKYCFDVGVEIPCIPGTLKKMERLCLWLDENTVKFLNLNEFEFSEIQYEEMQKRGFKPVSEGARQVKGSRALAEKVLAFAEKNCKSLSVHFCPAMLKDAYQYTNRIRRRAKNIAKPFERITDDGLIEKGAIFAKIEQLGFLPKNELFFRADAGRVETSVKNAKLAAKKGFKAAIVLELPTADGFDFELDPL